MVQYVEKNQSVEAKAEITTQVRSTAEGILANIRVRRLGPR